MYSFAPHISEELWQMLGKESLIHQAGLPKYEEKYLEKDEIDYVVQVMGKIRGKITVSVSATNEKIKELAIKQENVQKYIQGKEIKKIIVVPKKLVSIVAK